jgi:uncharacterized membrane protein
MKKFFLYTMSLFYTIAGINHFVSPDFYLAMIPGYLPFPEILNFLSGAAEIGLGVLLLSHKYRVYAAYGIMLLLLAVFPANVHMLTTAMASSEPQVPIWALVVRLPIQLLFIFWAWSVRDYRPKGK